MKTERMVLKIPCKFDALNIKRSGYLRASFRIAESELTTAMKSVIGIGRKMAAKINMGEEAFIVGFVQFGSLSIDHIGESVLRLESTVASSKLQLATLGQLVDEDIILQIIIALTEKAKNE